MARSSPSFVLTVAIFSVVGVASVRVSANFPDQWVRYLADAPTQAAESTPGCRVEAVADVIRRSSIAFTGTLVDVKGNGIDEPAVASFVVDGALIGSVREVYRADLTLAYGPLPEVGRRYGVVPQLRGKAQEPTVGTCLGLFSAAEVEEAARTVLSSPPAKLDAAVMAVGAIVKPGTRIALLDRSGHPVGAGLGRGVVEALAACGNGQFVEAVATQEGRRLDARDLSNGQLRSVRSLDGARRSMALWCGADPSAALIAESVDGSRTDPGLGRAELINGTIVQLPADNLVAVAFRSDGAAVAWLTEDGRITTSDGVTWSEGHFNLVIPSDGRPLSLLGSPSGDAWLLITDGAVAAVSADSLRSTTVPLWAQSLRFARSSAVVALPAATKIRWGELVPPAPGSIIRGSTRSRVLLGAAAAFTVGLSGVLFALRRRAARRRTSVTRGPLLE